MVTNQNIASQDALTQSRSLRAVFQLLCDQFEVAEGEPLRDRLFGLENAGIRELDTMTEYLGED